MKTATESGLRKQAIISELTKSPHGELAAYNEVGLRVASEDREFFAHVIAWNQAKGKVRDAKVALPVIALRSLEHVPGVAEYRENAAAALSKQDPRTLLRGLDFAKTHKVRVATMRPIVSRYLAEREADVHWWDRTALQHRKSLKALYARIGASSPRARAILQDRAYPPGSVFDVVARLGSMEPVAAAAEVVKRRIPFLIAKGALGKKLESPDVLLAVIKGMSAAELVTNMTMLEKLGVRQVPALRAALEDALGKVASSRGTRTPTLKTGRATAAVTDERLKAKLDAVQEKQIANMGVEGDWLVLGDKSGSMQTAIEAARAVAGTLAKVVKGEVRLTFFDVEPRRFDVTGKTLAQIQAVTRNVVAGGGTSIGCGLRQALDSGFEPDGIAIVSDAMENTAPTFPVVYGEYCKKAGRTVPVYLYRCRGNEGPYTQSRDLAATMRAAGHDMVEFDLRGGVDYYSLPNLIQTMRTNRYGLVQEILDTPLLTLAGVYGEKGEEGEDG